MGSRLENKRLGIILGTIGARDAEGAVWMSHGQGRIIDAMRDLVAKARVCVPIMPEHHGKMKHRLRFAPDEITALPPLRSTREAQRHFLETSRVIREFASGVDCLFIRLPFQVPRALLGLGTPKVLHLAGDPVEAVKASSDYRGIWRFLARHYARHSNATMARLVAEPCTRVVSNGQELWDKLHCHAGKVVVSTCIYQDEIVPRSNFDLNDPPRLLFVGYLRPEKGVDTLLAAFHRLRASRPLRLTIVGGSDRISRAEQQTRDSIAASPYASDITLTGMIDFGPPLFDLYREHDVCVLPSLSEGTPRTLVEARAFGCPVVATRVGGIPTSVTHGIDGLLVPPADPEALAAAIARMLDDDHLRRRLIGAGRTRWQNCSVENFAAELVEQIEMLFSERAVDASVAQW